MPKASFARLLMGLSSDFLFPKPVARFWWVLDWHIAAAELLPLLVLSFW